MEAMIRNTIMSKSRTSASRLMMHYGAAPEAGALPLKAFLSSLAPIIAREPRVCVEAIKATCALQEGGGSGRGMVVLKKPKVCCGWWVWVVGVGGNVCWSALHGFCVLSFLCCIVPCVYTSHVYVHPMCTIYIHSCII